MEQYKRQKNKKTGEERLMIKPTPNSPWVPALEYHQRKTAEEESPVSAALIGAGKRVADLGSIFGMGPDESDQAGYDALKKAHPVATTAGEVASEIAQIAVPGGIASKGLKAAPKIGGAMARNPGKTAALTDFLASVGTAGMREEDMLSEGAMSLGGSALGTLLKPLARGLKTTDDAAKYIDEGGDMMIAQGITNPIASNVDNFLRMAPGPAGLAARHKLNAARDFSRVAIKKAALDPSKITETGRKGASQMLDQFEEAYSGIWSSIDEFPREASRNMLEVIQDGAKKVDLKGTSSLESLQEQIADLVTKHRQGSISAGESADMIDKAISQAIAKTDDYRLNKVLMRTKDALRESMPNNIQQRLMPIDAKYPEFLTINEAARSAKSLKGHFSPTQLTQAGDRVGGNKFGYIGGTNPLSDIAEIGESVIEREIHEAPIVSTVTGAARPMFPNPVVKQGSKLLMGGTKPQRLAKKGIGKLEQMDFLPGMGNLGASSDTIEELLRELGLSD